MREEIARQLRLIRKKNGWSQEQLAKRAGLDRTYLSGVERMSRNLTLDSLEKILKALGTTPRDFFHGLYFKDL